MAKLKIVVEIDYDEKSMHTPTPDGLHDFKHTFLAKNLFLHSNTIGECFADVKVIGFVDQILAVAEGDPMAQIEFSETVNRDNYVGLPF